MCCQSGPCLPIPTPALAGQGGVIYPYPFRYMLLFPCGGAAWLTSGVGRSSLPQVDFAMTHTYSSHNRTDEGDNSQYWSVRQALEYSKPT